MLNALLDSQNAAAEIQQAGEDAAAKAREAGAPTTQASSTSAGALESSRQLAQMYANRMGRRVSKAPAPTPVAPKDKEIILDKTANNMDQNNLDKWFLRLHGVDKFNTIPTKQRNAMLMQYNNSKVKR